MIAENSFSYQNQLFEQLLR